MDKFITSRMLRNFVKSRTWCSRTLIWRSLNLGKRDLGKSAVASCTSDVRDTPATVPLQQCKVDLNTEWQLLRRELRSLCHMLQRSGLVTQSQILNAGLAWDSRRQYSTPSDKEPSSDDKDDQSSDQSPWGKRPPNTYFLMTMFFFSFVLGVSSLFLLTKASEKRNITWEEFYSDLLLKGEIESVEIPEPTSSESSELVAIHVQQGAQINGYMIPHTVIMKTPNKGWFEQKLQDAEDALNVPRAERIPVSYTKSMTPISGYNFIILWACMIIWLIIFTRVRRMKRNATLKKDIQKKPQSSPLDMMNPFKMNITRGDEVNNPKFKDVAGLREAKVEIQEFVDYLKTPQRFKDIGAKIPKGALLLGPPGCGKTFLAKALAGESEVPFLALSGTDFIQMIGGLGAKRVRDLFKEARSCAPCIVYIDEIDTIGKKRGGTNMGSDEFDQTLNQMLTEMDGMQTTEGVIVLASTNRAHVLDEALLRPGRLDRHILIDLPTMTERIELYELYLAKLKLAIPVSLLAPKLAQLTPGMSGADIANICNEAAIHAAREKQKEVFESDLFYAVDRVLQGPEKKSSVLTADTRKIVSIHEGGHTLVGWKLRTTDAITKVSIVPRAGKNVLGFNRRTRAEHKLYSKEYLYEQMCVLLGGRAAEAIIFNRVTDGAEDDLKKVTEFAYRMVKEFGMSDSVGPLSFSDGPGLEPRPYSEYLQNIMDIEARQLINKAYRQTEEIVNLHKDELKLLSEALLEKETLTYSDIEKILGPPPHGSKSSNISLDLPV